MFHLIKYSVIRKVKNFSILFWPFVFPLILGTLFYFAFGNISESDFETVQAAFVKENQGDSAFPAFLEEVSKEGTLIHVETMTEKEALQKLEDQKISGIFYGTETPYLKVGKNGLAQSIMQSLLESYLNGKENIPKSCMIIGGLDTVIAVLAGIAIFPAVFAFGLEPGQGPGLIFGTLPMVFANIAGGTFFAILFFALVFFAAVTSAIALLEVCASFAIDSLGWERKPAALVIGTAITLLGIPSALSFGVLSDVTILNQSVFDFAGLVTDNILMPLGGLTMCYYVGWKWKPEYLLAEIEADGTKFRLGKLWVFCIRFLTPIMVGIVSVTGFYNLYLAIR